MKTLAPLAITLLILTSTVNAKSNRAEAAETNSNGRIDNDANIVQADPEYARNFLNSFNSFCPTTGSWTHNSLAATREIEKVLVNLRDDPNCVDIANSIATHTQTLSYALDRIQRTSLERDIFAVQRQQADILFLLGSETDPAKIMEMEDLYRSNQFYLSLEEGKLQYDKDRADEYYQTNVMVNAASQLFQQAALNQMCLIKSPTLLSSLSSIGTSFAAAFVTGGASLGFAAASHVLGYVFDFIRKSKINKDIQQLGQVEFITAYQCVLESISNQWCQAQEAADIIDLKTSYSQSEPDTFSIGVRILNRELPVLVTWLNSVRAATDPQNTSISARQVNFLARENILESWRLTSIATLGDEKDKLPNDLNNDSNKELQFNLLKNAIVSMSPGGSGSQGGGPPNPILDIASSREIPWLIAGIPIEDVPTTIDFSGSTVPQSLGAMTPSLFLAEPKLAAHYPLDPIQIERGINDLFQQADETLARQRNNVLHADPEILFWDAETPLNVGSIRGISPLSAIDSILKFFNDHFSVQFQDLYSRSASLGTSNANSFGNGSDPLCPMLDPGSASNNRERIYIQTRNVFCEIKNQINDFGGEPSDRLNSISEVARLENGTTAIEERVKKTMRVILTRILADQSNDNLPTHAKLLVVDDIINELTQYGKSNLSTQMLDIEQALQINEMTLQNFTEIFAEGIAKTFNTIALRYQQRPQDSQLLAKYCSLLLAVPNWNQPELAEIKINYCNGIALKSEWGQKEIYGRPFSANDFRSDYVGTRRACHLRGFLRQELFYQNYNQRSLSRTLLLQRNNGTLP